MSRSLLAVCVAEAFGTFLLVLLGCGAVHAATLAGAQSGLWQVAIVWGIAIMLAAYVVGPISGAHINPAITIALAAARRFPARRVAPYIVSQLAGAYLAAAALYAVWSPWIEAVERERGIVRGSPASVITASCYGEYFPNPGAVAKFQTGGEFPPLVSHAAAFGAEVLGTLILAVVVFALTDERRGPVAPVRLEPVFIGLTVACLISIIAPLTQACFNPARDLGPRLFAWGHGWGEAAIPGPNGIGFFTVYILAPILGAAVGAGWYEFFLARHRPDRANEPGVD